MLIPSPDGVFIANLLPISLKIYTVQTGELLFTIPLSIRCKLLVWDESLCSQEYRLAISAQRQCLTVGFKDTDPNYYMSTMSVNGPIRSIQWTPMVNSRGRVLVRLAIQSDAPDSASLWVNNGITGQYSCPKSRFIPLPSLNGWALLHCSHALDRVLFFCNGRYLSDIAIPTTNCHAIVGCVDSALVAVADTSNLYIIGTTRIIAKLQNLIVDQMIWMRGGEIIVTSDNNVLRISPTLEIKYMLDCQVVQHVQVIMEKQVIEVTSGHAFQLRDPILSSSRNGKHCAVQVKAHHLVIILNSTDSTPILIDYRNPNTHVEWHLNALCFIFNDFGAIWTSDGFQIVDFPLENVIGLLPLGTTNKALMWNQESFKTGMTLYSDNSGSPSPEEIFNMQENGIREARTPASPYGDYAKQPSTLTPFLLQMAPLRIPTVSPYMNDYILEDTFHYKRGK